MREAELRDRAIDMLGAHADERALDVLRTAEIVFESSQRAWEGTAGTISGDEITLLVTSAQLGLIRAAPAVEDLVTAAFAAALASDPRHSLARIAFRWSRNEPGDAPPYRGGGPVACDPSDPEVLTHAVRDYLRAGGGAGFADELHVVSLDTSHRQPRVSITLPEPSFHDASTRARIERAVCDLIDAERVRLVVTR